MGIFDIAWIVFKYLLGIGIGLFGVWLIVVITMGFAKAIDEVIND